MDCGSKRFGAMIAQGWEGVRRGRPAAAAAARGGEQGAVRRAGVNDWHERFEPGRARPGAGAATTGQLEKFLFAQDSNNEIHCGN
jgi:hypothetical protein